MLSKSRQREYIRTRWDTIIIHFDRFAKRTNAEHVHQIRVELKKIRALIFLNENVYGPLPSRLTKPIRRIFKQAGIVRSAQVSTQLVKQHRGVPQEFFNEQRTIVAQEAKRFVSLVNLDADELVQTNLQIWKRLRRIRLHDVREIISKLERRIHSVFRPKFRVTQLHNARKDIKRLVYICNMLGSSDVSRLNVDVKKYHELEELIGKWHDADFTVELMEEYTLSTKSSVRKLQRNAASLVREIRKTFSAIKK